MFLKCFGQASGMKGRWTTGLNYGEQPLKNETLHERHFAINLGCRTKKLSTTSETDEYWDKLNINFDLLLQWFFQQVKDNSQMPDVDFPFLDVPGS